MNTVDSSRKNQEAVRSVFLIVLAVNASLAIAKLVYGSMFGLLTMVADGLHSFLDCSANALAALAVHISMKPPDDNHPYGHRKFEALTAMIISCVMFFSCWEIITEAFHRFSSPGHLQQTSLVGYLIMFAGLIANLLVTKFEEKKAKELNNTLLAADSKHSMSDVFTTLVVLVSLVSVQLKFPLLDMVGSILIVAAIVYAGYQIIVSHLGMLVDEAAFDAHEIENVVMKVQGVVGCHKIRSRGTGDHVFIDLHVQVSRHMSIEEAHGISYKVESALKDFSGRDIDVLVHVEDDNPPASNHDHAHEH